MIKLVKISIDELKQYVTIAYENDSDLFDKYHIGKFNLEQCVESTMAMIKEMCLYKEVNHYAVMYKNKSIGYVDIFENYLYSYGIAIAFRKKKILVEWWDEVRKTIGT